MRGDQHVPMVRPFVEGRGAGADRPGAVAEPGCPAPSAPTRMRPGDRAADDPGDDREDQIERADVLVVGRHEPAGEEARLVVGVVVRVMRLVRLQVEGVGGGAHGCLVLRFLILRGRGLVGRGLAGRPGSARGGRRRRGRRAAAAAARRACGRPSTRPTARTAPRGTTSTAIGMKPWRAPHSSEHCAEIDARAVDLDPGLVELAGVGVLLDPEGRARAKLWITSSAVMMNFTTLPCGITSRSSTASSGGPSSSVRARWFAWRVGSLASFSM